MKYRLLVLMMFTLALVAFINTGFFHRLASKDVPEVPAITEESLTLEEVVVEDIVPESSTTTPSKAEAKATTTAITKQIPELSLVPAAETPTPMVETPVSTPPPAPSADFSKINTESRPAIVNILCTVKGNEFNPISGTGIIISENGLILTNAHVAQYFLLRNFREPGFVDCIIRTGSPAYPRYKAELVYLSPKWVNENKALLKNQNPTGTGENDFAFIRITQNSDGSTASSPFPFVRPNVSESITVGDPTLLVSYPAGFLGGLSILQGLSVTSAVTNIQDVYTFSANTTDIIAVGGTVVSQKGSSGGAVVDKNTSVIGIISTSSMEGTTGARQLNAITVPYINRSLQAEAGISLNELISSNLAEFSLNFQLNTAKELTRIIAEELLTP